MNPFACLSGLLSIAAAVAQDLLPSPIQPVGARAAATNNSGLQPTRDGLGLRGGGADYRAAFSAAGLRFEPALGANAPSTQHLALRPVAVQRGATTIAHVTSPPRPVQHERTASYEHAPGLSERFDVRADGVELSWVFAAPPAGEGDLVVRYAVDTSLPAPRPANGGLEFVHDGLGGVRIGDVTGVDATGRTADGDVRWVDGQLELTLPHAFVATAAYPLVLDPLIGGVINVSSGLTYADGEPDVAYDATTNNFLVVWQRTFSATNTDVRGQLVSHWGTLVGSTIFFNSTGLASRPRVANLGVRDRFGVVWTQQAGSTSTVEFETAAALDGALGFATNLATSTTSQFKDADIGAETAAPIGTARGFVIVYEDDDLDAIRARRLWFNSSDQLVTASAFSVFTNSALGSTYTQPAISRRAAPDGRLLAVARRASVLFAGVAIDSMVLDAGTNVLYTSTDIVSTTTEDVRAPDVDGYGGRWVVAWERNVNGPNFYDQVRIAPVTLDNNTLTVGSGIGFGGTLTVRGYAPTVGYSPGRTWIGYQQVATLPSPTTTLRVAAVDSGSCTSCNDSFSVGFPDGPRIVVATQDSGGFQSGEDCLCVYHNTFDDIDAQLLRNYGTSGTVQDLGGGCGGSFQSCLQVPGIGASHMTHVAYFQSTTLFAVFNLSAPQPTANCGPCVWLPFSVTMAPPVALITSSASYAIPCLPMLVGAQLETQWTLFDPAHAPCPQVPGIAMTNRLLLTIGQ